MSKAITAVQKRILLWYIGTGPSTFSHSFVAIQQVQYCHLFLYQYVLIVEVSLPNINFVFVLVKKDDERFL